MTFRDMLQKVLAVVGLRFGGAAISLFSQIIFARIFSPAEVGIVFLGMSAASLLSLFASAGYPALALTNLPRYIALGRNTLVARFHSAFLRDTTVLTSLFFLIVVLIYFFANIDSGIKTALLFGCLSVPASVLLRYNSVMANSVRRFPLSYIPDFFYRPGLLLAYIALLYLFGIKPSVPHVLLAFIVANTLVGFGQAYLLGDDSIQLKFWSHHNARFTKHLRNRAAALVIVAAVATSYSDLVTMIAGFLLPAADVAQLGVSIRLAAIAGFVVQASQQFVVPDLTQAITLRDDATVRNLLLRMNVITIATVIASLIGVIVLGDFALGLFGPSYRDAKFLLILFLIGQSIRAFSGMNQHMLSIAGRQIRTAGACLTALLILVSLSIILSRNYGVIGIGYAVIVGELVWTILLASQAQHLLGRRGDLLWVLTKR